jgi:hypothetical protein
LGPAFFLVEDRLLRHRGSVLAFLWGDVPLRADAMV